MTYKTAIFGAVPWLGLAVTIGAAPLTEPTIAKKQDSEILAKGLKVWRKPGAINNGAACATCHSPDGIELAAYNFTNDDVIRRALPHLPPEDATVIVDYLHALREKYKLNPLRDPMTDRPLQPGGDVLPGDTPADRDLAFGKELEAKFPLLFGSPISSVEQAHAAETQLLQVPANQLKIGFAVNRISEDVAHGKEHASIAQWFPEVEPTIPAASISEWYALEDQYLQDPTPKNLRTLIVKHSELVPTSRMVGFAALSTAKFRALMIWQDRIRNHTEYSTANVSSDVIEFSNDNPVWDVGEIARQIIDRTPAQIGMDATNQSKKTVGPPLADQLHQLRLAWFWLGWLSDQGMFKTSLEAKTRLGMWQAQSLSLDGPYPIHSVYSNVRRQAVISNDPSAWGETPQRKRRLWDFAGLRSFEYHERDIPTQPENRKLYFKFLCNSIRMNLFLIKESIEKTNVVWVKKNSHANAGILVEYVKKYDPADAPEMDKLLTELNASIDKAVEKIAK